MIRLIDFLCFLFFASVTRKLTTVGHSGLNPETRQNPAIQNKPDGNDTENKRPFHLFTPLFAVGVSVAETNNKVKYTYIYIFLGMRIVTSSPPAC